MQEARGLRARRLKQTWQDIHHIAAQDCLQHGPEGVNTARIAEAAGVSPRTFFNYFATKEDAILGIGRPELRPRHLEAFVNGTQHRPLLRVGLLTLSVVATSLGETKDPSLRLQLVEKYPELNSRVTDTVLRSRDLVMNELVLDVDELWLGAKGLPMELGEAQTLVMIAFNVVALSWRQDPIRLATDPEKALTKAIRTMVSTLKKSL